MYAAGPKLSQRARVRAGGSRPSARAPALAVDVVALGVVLAAAAGTHAAAPVTPLGTTLRTEESREPGLAVPTPGYVVATANRTKSK